MHFDSFSVKNVVDGGGVLHSLQSLVIAENLVGGALARGAIFCLKFETITSTERYNLFTIILFIFLDTSSRTSSSAPGLSKTTVTRPVCSRTVTATAWVTKDNQGETEFTG